MLIWVYQLDWIGHQRVNLEDLAELPVQLGFLLSKKQFHMHRLPSYHLHRDLLIDTLLQSLQDNSFWWNLNGYKGKSEIRDVHILTCWQRVSRISRANDRYNLLFTIRQALDINETYAFDKTCSLCVHATR